MHEYILNVCNKINTKLNYKTNIITQTTAADAHAQQCRRKRTKCSEHERHRHLTVSRAARHRRMGGEGPFGNVSVVSLSLVSRDNQWALKVVWCLWDAPFIALKCPLRQTPKFRTQSQACLLWWTAEFIQDAVGGMRLCALPCCITAPYAHNLLEERAGKPWRTSHVHGRQTAGLPCDGSLHTSPSILHQTKPDRTARCIEIRAVQLILFDWQFQFWLIFCF